MAADDELRKMEKYLTKIFSEAEKDLIEKALKYMADFERKDKVKQSKVENGNISDEEYKEWRKNQLLYGEHWTRLIQSVQNEMATVNQTALDYINDKTTKIYADSYNSIATVIKQSPVEGYSFELVDSNTVKNLAKEEGIILPPKKNLDVQKDKLWNAKQVNAQLLQGILQGESIQKIAGRMAKVCESNKSASIRNARTMVTAAENSGRQSGMNKAESDGIIFKKMWIATRDERTRESHMVLNGQLVANGEKFVTINGDEIEFPGDWRARASEVYNCRCTLGIIVTGFKKMKLEATTEKQQEAKGTEQVAKNIDFVSSVQEVTEMLRDSGWFRNPEKSNNLEGVDIESAKMIYKTYEKLFNKYPFLKEKFLGVESETAGETQFACASRQKIYVNNVWFSDYNNMRDEYLYSVKTGFHTKGTDVDSILVHEFGHNIDMFMAEVLERSSFYESSTFKRKVMNKFDKNISIRKEVSGYAEKNVQEWFAECFAEYFCSEEPRQVAKAFGEELEKHLEKVEKEYNKKVEKAKQKTKIKLGG